MTLYKAQIIMKQKEGIEKVASIYDALSQSNRKKEQTFKGVDEGVSHALEDVINKVAENLDDDGILTKTASFSNGLALFTAVRKRLSDELGVSEMIVQDMTSDVIVKSEKILAEYGGEQTLIIDSIIQEIKEKVESDPDKFPLSTSMQPQGVNVGNLQETIKKRLIEEVGVSYQKSELYKMLVFNQARDLETIIRPFKKEEIAMSIIDILIDTKDLSSVYGLKDSPHMVTTLRTQLGG